MFKRIKSLLCACLIVLLLTGVGLAKAEGIVPTKVYIIANTLNAYQRMDTNSRVLGVMTYGEDMTMLSFSGSWVQIRNAKGQIGYCALNGLSTQNPNTLNEVVYAKQNNTLVYQKASTTYNRNKYVRVKMNYPFRVVAATPDKQWFRVRNGSIYGYVRLDDVSATPVNTTVHGAITSRIVFVNSENAVAVTSGMGTGSSMGTISHGQRYMLLGISGNWARIRNSASKVGYCPKDVLTTDNTNKLNQTMYAQVGGAILYPNSILKSGSAKQLRKNAAVTVVARTPEGGWYRVLVGGKPYYVPSVLLDAQPAAAGGMELLCTSSTKLYASPNLSSAVTGSVFAGESVILRGVSGTGAQVGTLSGATGYVPFGCLRKYF